MTDAQQQAVYTIWDTLADFPQAEIDTALEYLFGELSRLVRADNITWFAAVRLLDGPSAKHDLVLGWRMRSMETWRPRPGVYERIRRLEQQVNEKCPVSVIGETSIRLASTAGKFRVQPLHGDWLDMAEFRRTAHYDVFYRQPQIDDRLFVAFPLTAQCESFFVLDKVATRSRFTAEDAAMAGFILRGLKWFHRNLALSRGLVAASSPLTPTERKVVQWLLTGKAEKEIADLLQISTGTTHNYVVTIYRKFGVRSRAEFTSLWLGGERPVPARPRLCAHTDQQGSQARSERIVSLA